MKHYIVRFVRGTSAAERRAILTGHRATLRNGWRESFGAVVQSVDIPDDNAPGFEAAMQQEDRVDHIHQK